jgi:hypothetical protein
MRGRNRNRGTYARRDIQLAAQHRQTFSDRGQKHIPKGSHHRISDETDTYLAGRILQQIIEIERHLLGILGIEAPRQEAQTLPIEGTRQPDDLV